MSNLNGTNLDIIQQAAKVVGMPKVQNPTAFNLSEKRVIKRLCLPLPNLVDGEGKNAKVITARYAYMYPDVPDTFFISPDRLFGKERGIQVFFLDFWHSTGLVGFQSDTEEDDKNKRVLLEGLEESTLFTELSTKYTLKALLGMGYISERCLMTTLEQEALGQETLYNVSYAAVNSNATLDTLQQLQIVDTVAKLGQRTFKNAEPNNTAITEEKQDREVTGKQSNLADGNIVPGIPDIQEDDFSIVVTSTVIEDTTENEEPELNPAMVAAFTKATTTGKKVNK